MTTPPPAPLRHGARCAPSGDAALARTGAALARTGAALPRTGAALPVLTVLLVVEVLLVAGGWFGPGVAPAAAHSRLVRSVPADGSTVAKPPRQLRLEFNENVMKIGVVVRVSGPQGEVTSGTTAVKGRTVTRDLTGDLPAGEYLVGWRVTSADGHPLSGSVRFTARTGTDGKPDTTPGTASPGSGTATSGAGASSTATGGPAGAEFSPGPADRTSGDPLGGLESRGPSMGISTTVIALGVVLAGLSVGAVVLGLRRRLGPPPGNPTTDPPRQDPPITDRTREADDN